MKQNASSVQVRQRGKTQKEAELERVPENETLKQFCVARWLQVSAEQFYICICLTEQIKEPHSSNTLHATSTQRLLPSYHLFIRQRPCRPWTGRVPKMRSHVSVEEQGQHFRKPSAATQQCCAVPKHKPGMNTLEAQTWHPSSLRATDCLIKKLTITLEMRQNVGEINPGLQRQTSSGLLAQ